jgi:hypothetical protein
MSKPPKDHKLIVTIADALKPWRRPWREEEILRAVSAHVASLRKDVSEYDGRDAIINTRHAARDVIETIAKLNQQISRTPLLRRFIALRSDDPLFGRLKFVNDLCEGLSAESRGDKVKAECAETALRLVQVCSAERPTSGSSDSRFRIIAGLLYKIVGPRTKNAIPDLRRACGEVLRQTKGWRELGLWDRERREALAQFATKKSSEM